MSKFQIALNSSHCMCCKFSDRSISYFIGKKAKGEEVIVYVHNDIFMRLDQRKPTVMLIVKEKNIIEEIKAHMTKTVESMDEITGVEDFIKYLDGKIKSTDKATVK